MKDVLCSKQSMRYAAFSALLAGMATLLLTSNTVSAASVAPVLPPPLPTTTEFLLQPQVPAANSRNVPAHAPTPTPTPAPVTDPEPVDPAPEPTQVEAEPQPTQPEMAPSVSDEEPAAAFVATDPFTITSAPASSEEAGNQSILTTFTASAADSPYRSNRISSDKATDLYRIAGAVGIVGFLLYVATVLASGTPTSKRLLRSSRKGPLKA